jgi:hypothetical protein
MWQLRGTLISKHNSQPPLLPNHTVFSQNQASRITLEILRRPTFDSEPRVPEDKARVPEGSGEAQ